MSLYTVWISPLPVVLTSAASFHFELKSSINNQTPPRIHNALSVKGEAA